MIDAVALAANLEQVRARISQACVRAGRDPADVMLVAATKTVPPPLITLARDQGIRVVGENRVQEARDKIAAAPGLRWELIGPLQRNKIRLALEIFARIQTIEDEVTARAIERIAAERSQIVPILLQVNVAQEASKHGVASEEVLHLAEIITALPHLCGEGLMTIAPYVTDPESVRPVFARLRQLRDDIRARFGATWAELSMGMSDDFPIAIEEGATLVRIGRAIFGDRHP